jgi:hypothetical protein
MSKNIYFICNMIQPGYWSGLSEAEKIDVNEYLEEMAHGPADGEMDIAWHENLQGYYRHLEIYDSADESDRQKYKDMLITDMAAWLVLSPDNYMVNQVKRIFSWR